MTLHSLRRRHPPADTLDRLGPPDWDATTATFAGASGSLADTGPITRHPHLEALPAPPPGPPRRPWDEAMPVLLRDGTFGLECGMDLWRIHFDPEAVHYRHSFDALRVSALRAGWRPDLFGRWCCPRCVADPAWAAPAAKALAHWHPGVPHAAARMGPDPFESVRYWLGRRATEYHRDSAAAYVAGDPADEFWFRVQAEEQVRERTAQAAVHGRHEAGAR